MNTAFIIHCSSGNPHIHWYPWLKGELEQMGMKVNSPQFPIGQDQTLHNWIKTLSPFEQEIPDSIMIGHSLGVPFIINVLNKENYRIKAAFLVGGFVGKLPVTHGEPNVADFAERAFDWEKIRSNCERFYVIHGDDDHLVPLSKAQELAYYLKVNVTVVQGGGHFQEQGGFGKFDQLLEMIQQEAGVDR